MQNQADLFKSEEGSAWYTRNAADIRKATKDDDRIYKKVSKHIDGYSNKSILEVGCSNGYRLSWFKNLGASVCGVEPGLKAVEEGKKLYGFSDEEILNNDCLNFFKTNHYKYDVIIFAHVL